MGPEIDSLARTRKPTSTTCRPYDSTPPLRAPTPAIAGTGSTRDGHRRHHGLRRPPSGCGDRCHRSYSTCPFPRNSARETRRWQHSNTETSKQWPKNKGVAIATCTVGLYEVHRTHVESRTSVTPCVQRHAPLSIQTEHLTDVRATRMVESLRVSGHISVGQADSILLPEWIDATAHGNQKGEAQPQRIQPTEFALGHCAIH